MPPSEERCRPKNIIRKKWRENQETHIWKNRNRGGFDIKLPIVVEPSMDEDCSICQIIGTRLASLVVPGLRPAP
jgi:hypothetical protein